MVDAVAFSSFLAMEECLDRLQSGDNYTRHEAEKQWVGIAAASPRRQDRVIFICLLEFVESRCE